MAERFKNWGSQISDDEDIWEKPVSDWTVQDVCNWLQYGPLQNNAGLVQTAYTHDISGRALLRLTDELLQRMGIHQGSVRRAILVEVLELRLQQELQQLLYITEGWYMFMTTGSKVNDSMKRKNQHEIPVPDMLLSPSAAFASTSVADCHFL
ncbi:sterile alpha motif domain-containing protein 12-like [Gastrophryne carolinensis]